MTNKPNHIDRGYTKKAKFQGIQTTTQRPQKKKEKRKEKKVRKRCWQLETCKNAMQMQMNIDNGDE